MNALVLGFAALAGGAAAAMPGIAPTPGFGIPLQAALNGDNVEHCSDDDQAFNFNYTLEGCKAKCVELYPNVSLAQFYVDDTVCCCVGLTAAQADMAWCHINMTGEGENSQSYYWLTGPCAEPAACLFNDTTGFPLYSDGMYDCVATDVAPTTTTVTPDTMTTDSSTSAASSTTVTSSEVASSSTPASTTVAAAVGTPGEPGTTVGATAATAGAPTNETANTTAAATSTTQTASEVSKAPASYVLIMVGLCVVALFVH